MGGSVCLDGFVEEFSLGVAVPVLHLAELDDICFLVDAAWCPFTICNHSHINLSTVNRYCIYLSGGNSGRHTGLVEFALYESNDLLHTGILIVVHPSDSIVLSDVANVLGNLIFLCREFECLIEDGDDIFVVFECTFQLKFI